MKRLFIVVAKLLGLMQLSQMVIVPLQIAPLFGFFAESGAKDADAVAVRLWALCGFLAYFLLSGALAWVLLARTEWLANRCRIPDSGGEKVPGAETLLRLGTVVVGVYVTVHALPQLGREMSSLFFYFPHMGAMGSANRLLMDALPAAIELALGLYLALRSDHVIRLIDKFQKRPNETAAPAGE